MKTAVVALTAKATQLAADLAPAIQADLHVQEKHSELVAGAAAVFYRPPLGEHVRHLFAAYRGIVFVMASGIVVRYIAPLLRSKLDDPAVVVVDEAGRHAISLLSGHLGGANELAAKVAAAIGAEPVITTATDLASLTAPDVLARRNRCTIGNPALIKTLNAALLAGETLSLFTPFPVAGPPPARYRLNPPHPGEFNLVLNSRRTEPLTGQTLYLRPRHLVLGVGCRRGAGQGVIEAALTDLLDEHGLCRDSLHKVASIDLKADEPGLLALAAGLGVPLLTYSAAELAAMPGTLADSSFVREVTGTGNVCEAAALAAAAPGGELLVPKTAGRGVTLAVTGEDYRVVF